MKKIFVFLFVLFSFLTVYSQKQPTTPSHSNFIKTWRVSDRFDRIDSILIDTVSINFQNNNPIDRFSISNSFNGNLGSPIQSKLYFDRPENTDFMFSNAYYPYMMNDQHVLFYNTNKPFSNLNYISGGAKHRNEDNIKFLFTGNANKRLNIGTTLDYLSSPGMYMNQAVTRFSGSLFGSYDGKHYSAKALLATNKMKNQENGGLKNAADILNGYSSLVIPTNIAAQSNYLQKQIYYSHQYTIGFERAVKVSKDSTRMDYVPVTRFSHTFRYDDVQKRYFENSVENTFYANTYYRGTQTKDTAALRTFANNISISLSEEFNKLMRFGLTAFLENETQNFKFQKDSLLNNKTMSSTKFGGILSKKQGQRFRYSVLGELGFLGYKAGNFSLEGNVGGFFKLWNDSISLVANGFVRSEKPTFFMNQYESNHFKWQNDFESVYRTHFGGTFSIPTRLFSLNVSVENLTQYIYFNSSALPEQYSGNIQLLVANLKQDFHFGKFSLENNVVSQVSSNADVVPLPALTLFHNLYYHNQLFHVLSFQIGTSVRYHTSYHAPAYMPATGQFYTQSTTKIGNYPLTNVYLNCHLKRTRFFVEYYHFNNKFMKGDYFSMPNYPLNPPIVKLGISWNFYD